MFLMEATTTYEYRHRYRCLMRALLELEVAKKQKGRAHETNKKCAPFSRSRYSPTAGFEELNSTSGGLAGEADIEFYHLPTPACLIP